MNVQIPFSPKGAPVFPERHEKEGFLDLMTLSKTAYSSSYQVKTDDVGFQFSVRPDEKNTRWQGLERVPGTLYRFSLPTGRYVVRINVGGNQYMKDVPVVIEDGKHTLLFYNSEVFHIKNFNVQHHGITSTASNRYGGSMRFPYFVDIQDYPARSHDEEALLEALVDPDWRVRAYVALLLGQFGTKNALPALENLRDDVAVRVVAQRAIERIKGPAVASHQLKGGVNR